MVHERRLLVSPTGGTAKRGLAGAVMALSLVSVSPSYAQVAEPEPVEITQAETVQAETPQDFDRAFRRLKADGSLQFDLPTVEPPPVRERRSWGWLAALLAGFASIAIYLVWTALALLAAGLIWFLARSFMDVRIARKARPEAEATPLYEPQAATVRTHLAEVDALAADGRFREAIHLLLFRAIEDIDRARPGQVRRSLTSREIGRLPALTDRTRAAFVTIARINERGWFGGLRTDREQFDAARAAYAQFGRTAETLPNLSGVPGATA